MERTQWLVLALAVALLTLSLLLVLPFLEFVLLAILLAYLLRPLQVRLETYINPRVTAGGLVVGATLVIVLPLLLVVRVLVDEVTRLLEQLRQGDVTLDELEAEILAQTGYDLDIATTLRDFARNAELGLVDNAIATLSLATHVLIGLGLTLFLLYYFLKDARRFRSWLQATSPLRPDIYEELVAEFDDVMRAVLVSHVFVAVVQGLVAGIGLFVLGVPNAIFWTVIMIVLAVLPIIGSFMVWGPAAVYLFLIGRPLAAAGLFVYGTIVVGLTDDFLRPIVIERYTERRLNPGVIILGVLGGLYFFGFIGIFFGPVILGLLRSVLDVYRREFVEGEAVEGS